MGAPKGNKNAIGNKGGRPRMFESVGELEEKINLYFKECDDNTEEVINKEGNVVTVKKPLPYTVEGLCLALGFNSRQGLLNYEGRLEFMDIIKKAKTKCLNNKITGAMTGRYNPTIVIFDLKNNHDFRDVKEHDHTSGGKPIDTLKVIIERATKEDDTGAQG